LQEIKTDKLGKRATFITVGQVQSVPPFSPVSIVRRGCTTGFRPFFQCEGGWKGMVGG